MATLRIKIKDKKFVSHNNVNVKEFSDNYVEGNGWICKMHTNGDFHCVSTGRHHGVEWRVKLRIQDGWGKLTLKKGDGQVQILKKYELQNLPADGVIGLSSGPINRRWAYFRDEIFQNFLDEYGITAMRCEPANNIYFLQKEISKGTTIFEEKVETDGNANVIFESRDYPEGSLKDSFMVYTEVEITEATWVIKRVISSGELTHKIVYTQGNPKEIEGLPKG